MSALGKALDFARRNTASAYSDSGTPLLFGRVRERRFFAVRGSDLAGQPRTSDARLVPREEHSVAPELRAAFDEERRALEALRAARRRLVDLIARADADGVPYDALARVAIRCRTGRAATVAERRREAARLRQLRRRANGRHAIPTVAGIDRGVNELPSKTKKEATMPRLVSRKITEEKFEADDADLDDASLDEADDLGESEAKSDTGDDEPDDKPARRAR
jgi:hypothetical protein